eukprot:PhF_6_TR37701/c0_g1_i1/m.56115
MSSASKSKRGRDYSPDTCDSPSLPTSIKLGCVCNSLKPSTKPKPGTHITCMDCDGKFHMKCVGITGDALVMFPPVGKASWVCPECTPDHMSHSVSANLLRCTTCKLTNPTKFLLQCSTCRERHHGECVGVSSVGTEIVLRSPSIKWVCQKCSTSG